MWTSSNRQLARFRDALLKGALETYKLSNQSIVAGVGFVAVLKAQKIVQSTVCVQGPGRIDRNGNPAGGDSRTANLHKLALLGFNAGCKVSKALLDQFRAGQVTQQFSCGHMRDHDSTLGSGCRFGKGHYTRLKRSNIDCRVAHKLALDVVEQFHQSRDDNDSTLQHLSDIMPVSWMVTFNFGHGLAVKVIVIKCQFSTLFDKLASIFPSRKWRHKLIRCGQFNIDIKFIFEPGKGFKEAKRLWIGFQVDVHRHIPPFHQYCRDPAREVDSTFRTNGLCQSGHQTKHSVLTGMLTHCEP